MKKTIIVTILIITGVLVFRYYSINNATTENYAFSNQEVLDTEYQVSHPLNEKQELNLSNKQNQASEISPSKLRLRILDVQTGIAIIPEIIEVSQKENKEVVYKFSKEDVSENGVILIPLKNGTYGIKVIASGYHEMSSFFSFNNDSLNVNFNIQPLVGPLELSSAYIRSLHRNDSHLIVGSIVDDFTGKPLSNVSVRSKDKIAETSSSVKGFFQMLLPLPKESIGLNDRNTLIFEKSGYTTEVRNNFDMWPFGDVILQIRMKKGTGENKEKVIIAREAEIVFQK